MTVTRDVIYDLLPAYFAGDVSADTRALVDEFCATDPEFGRMMRRFRELHDDAQAERRGDAAPLGETRAFDAVRERASRFQQTRSLAIGYAAAALFVLAVVLLGIPASPRAALAIAGIFGAVAGLSAMAAGFAREVRRGRRQSRWRRRPRRA
jgi:hypothetical protein